MPIHLIQELIIPGYNSLNQKLRSDFEKSPSGVLFLDLVLRTSDELSQLKERSGLWGFVFATTQKQQQSLQDQFLVDKTSLLSTLSQETEYNTLKMLIAYKSIKKVFSDFNYLNPDQKIILSQSDFSQTLVTEVSEIHRLIDKEYEHLSRLDFWASSHAAGRHINDSIADLLEKKKQLIDRWLETFAQTPQWSSLRGQILTNKYQKLANFFPSLNYLNTLETKPIPSQQSEVILSDDLQNFYLQSMKRANPFIQHGLPLEGFIQQQAQELTNTTLTAFHENKPVDIALLLTNYTNNLRNHVLNELPLINNRRWLAPPRQAKKEIINSLSFLWDNRLVDKTNQFVARLADAHAFIQATNFSTQNESSFLAILDMYNYARYHDQISETKNILASLLKPFQGVFSEYRDIGLYEKSTAMKFFRLLMPILITVATLIVISLILAPLALPELAFAAVLIPGLLLGLGLACVYVTIKNDMFKYCRDLYYGGSFEIPEFQVNPRMIAAFGDVNNAKNVRLFYIDELKRCDFIEEEFQSKADQSLLTQDDISNREKNRGKRHQLCLEWYDIHSNKDLGYELLRHVVIQTLQQTCQERYKVLETALAVDMPIIKASIEQSAIVLKQSVIKEDTLTPLKNPTISHNLGFFKPLHSLTHKAHVESLSQLAEQLVV